MNNINKHNMVIIHLRFAGKAPCGAPSTAIFRERGLGGASKVGARDEQVPSVGGFGPGGALEIIGSHCYNFIIIIIIIIINNSIMISIIIIIIIITITISIIIISIIIIIINICIVLVRTVIIEMNCSFEKIMHVQIRLVKAWLRCPTVISGCRWLHQVWCSLWGTFGFAWK